MTWLGPRAMHHAWNAALLLAAGLWVICTPRMDLLAAGDGSNAPGVEVAYCTEWLWLRGGPVCVLEAGGPPPNLRVRPPPEARVVQVVAGGRWLGSFAAGHELLITPRPRPGSWSEDPPGAIHVHFQGSAPRGAAWLQVRALGVERVWVWNLRLAAKNDCPRPVADDQATLVAALRAGCVLSQLKPRANLLDCAVKNWKLDEARRLLTAVRLPAATDAVARVGLAYSLGLLARKSGDFRSAIAELGWATDEIARLGIGPPWPEAIREEEALALLDVGRWQEATALLEQLVRAQESEKLDSCEGADLLDNEGWSLFLAREAGGLSGEGADVPAVLERAKGIYDRHACRGELRFNVRINLGLADLQRGDFRGAGRELNDAERFAGAAKPDQLIWKLEVKAQLALKQRPTEALQLYSQMEQLADLAVYPYGRWLAHFGQGRAYDVLEQVDRALSSYRKAAEEVESQSRRLPLFSGRESFLALREAGIRSYLDLLMRLDRKREACTLARQARSRVLRQLETDRLLAGFTSSARETRDKNVSEYWRLRTEVEREAGAKPSRLPQEKHGIPPVRPDLAGELKTAFESIYTGLDPGRTELTPAGKDEVILTYYPLGGRHWAGFAAGPQGVTMARRPIELPDSPARASPQELAKSLLVPFQAEIQLARRVRVLASGDLQEVDFHGLPFDGELLLSSHVVTYGLDLAPRGVPRPVQRRALVVGDPTGTLNDARFEGDSVEKALTAAGWKVDFLGNRPYADLEGDSVGNKLGAAGREGDARKSSAAEAGPVRKALGATDLLHYAGHGTVSKDAARTGLPLAGHTWLNVEDLLAVPRSPAWVVLSACETGRNAGATPLETVGVAQAFLLLGAHGVVAAMRPAGDRLARQLFAEFYRDLPAGDLDLAERLREAQLALARAHPDADWKAFRVFVP